MLILIVLLMIALTIRSDAFLTTRNLLNILTQNAPLAIVAMAGTLVIIAGGFDLSTGAIFAVASVSAAWIGLHHDPVLGLVLAPLVGLGLGLINGLIITGLRVHSFLATLATSLVYRGIAVLITGGSLISLTNDTTFAKLGRGKVGEVSYAIFILAAVFAALTFLARRTVAGRHIYAVGGNVDAAVLSGVRVSRIQILTFALSGTAAGIGGAITVSRVATGSAQAGDGVELQAIAAIILGGTSVYGGEGAVWRSFAGVMLLALINNGFNILNANPFYKDLTTGVDHRPGGRALCRRWPAMSATPSGGLTIEHARLFDPRTDEVVESTIHVADGVVTGLGGAAPAGADVIDADGRLVVAGLIDAHFHAYGVGLDVLEIEAVATQLRQPPRRRNDSSGRCGVASRPCATWPAATSDSPGPSTKG